MIMTSLLQVFGKTAQKSTRVQVVLTNNNRFPSCECRDRKKNMLPCEHILVIFVKIDVLDWNSFSVNYKDFPNLYLDINN